tara:strand:- start:139 stop:504 length:366 start_codon:yes stop_codon:yes gene_type:complete
MQACDEPKFKELIATIAETYSKPVTPVKFNVWKTIFMPYEIDDLFTAVFKHITDETKGTFEPKPADILRFMPEPKQTMMLENKGGVSGCENTRRLVDKYHPETGSYFKTIITNTDNLEVRR